MWSFKAESEIITLLILFVCLIANLITGDEKSDEKRDGKLFSLDERMDRDAAET